MKHSKHYLGQHFLIDKGALETIASALNIKPNDTIIEIGPGHGELTKEFRIKNLESRIIAIEKDKELAKDLKFRIQNLGLKNIEIVEGDALKEIKNQISRLRQGFGRQAKINPSTSLRPSALRSHQALEEIDGEQNRTIKNFTPSFFEKEGGRKSKIIKNLKIAGNIPYYITGYLFRILGELENKPSLIVFTIQKEVAERIASKPPEMNLLAASVQFWAKPEIVRIIDRKSFSPPPEVDSAVIKLTPKAKIQHPETYYKLIKILFKQPRKTILNNLTSGLNKPKTKIEEILKRLKINLTDRPQNLSINKIKNLSAEF